MNGVAIQFSASGTSTGCSTQPSFEWNFGDGTPRSSQQNPSKTYTTAGAYTWTLTTSVSSGTLMIDTIAGGVGEGNLARESPFGTLSAIVRDPQGRGVYVADSIGNTMLIRFINTGTSAVTIAGKTIEAGRVRAIAGGGFDLGENVPALQADLGVVTGLNVSSSGDLVYFVNQVDAQVRAINVSTSSMTVGSQQVGAGRVGTLASGFGTTLNGLAVNNSTGDLFVADATAGVNKVYRITSGGTSSVVAGSGGNTRIDDPFSAGAATGIPLLQPRSVRIDASGNLLIADTGHGRIIRVDSGGNATLVHQFGVIVNEQNQNPYPSGLTVVGGNVYVANGNSQTIVRVTGGVSTIAGQPGTACDYSVSICGDDAAAANSGFNMLGSTATPPLASIDADQNGIYVLDQGVTGRGRIRYINLTGGSVTLAGVAIAPGAIRTIAGNGLVSPYDGGLATGATFSAPVGVAIDGNGNLWIADTIRSVLRFANRGASTATIFPGTPSAQDVPAGQIVTVNVNVGSGATDGVPVIQAGFDSPQGMFVTGQGVYVVDSKGGPTVPPQFSGRRTSLIRFINTTSNPVTMFSGSSSPITVQPGYIAKVAGGSENSGSPGDGQFATNAKFIGASDIAVAPNGTMYITDVGQKAVRKIDGNTGIVSSLTLPSGAKQYTGVGFDSNGRLHIANFDDGAVLRESAAGSGSFSNFATGLGKPRDVAVAADGIAYVTNGPATLSSGNHQIMRIDTSGASTVIAGSSAGFSGDSGPASGAQLNIGPSPLVVGSGTTNQLPETVNIVIGQGGEILFTDSNNNRVRRISATVVSCVKTGTITISGNNPSPVLSSISPNNALINSAGFTLTATGSGFAPSSVVRWNGQDRATTFVSGTQLTAAIPSSDLTAAGAVQITVFTPAPGGGTSATATFTVTQPNPVPAISSLSPTSTTEGGQPFTLTVNGTGFVADSVVRWDGSERQTTFVNSTRVTAQILASDLIGAGQAGVTVFNPTPGGGVSNVSTFTITAGNNPAPVLSSISPASAIAGSAGFNLTANGSNFVNSSKVRWNGQELLTTFVTATQLSAQVPANLIATQGVAQVTVFTPAPGGGATPSQTFTINQSQGNPVPAVSAISPAAVAVNGPSFTLTVNGSNFINGSVVRINNNSRATTFVSATQLTASILAGDITTAGSMTVTVFNPAPGGGTSGGAELKVVPAVASVSAASFLGNVIAPESIVAAFGVNMATGVEVATSLPLPETLLGTRVRVRDSAGTERSSPLFFVAPSQINYLVPAGTVDGVATVTVSINNNPVSAGTMTIGRVAPGLISANANGQGVAAAVALRVSGSNQTFEPVARFDSGTNRFVPIPINMGPSADQIYLIMYGTGFRFNPGLDKVRVTMGGVDIPVLFAGEAPGFVGLDQANLGPVPRSLIGRGTVDLVMTVDGKVANTIQIAIQ
jgi:uncharacterized protein (TIGR03437 family)